MEILVILSPIFMMIALGGALHKGGLLPGEVLTGLNRLTYWVGLPVLVFVSLVQAEPGGSPGRLLVVLLVTTGVAAAVAWLLARLIGVVAAGRGTFVQAAFRGNLTFVGLPLLLTIPEIPRAAAVLTLAPLLVLYNSLSVALLLSSRHAGGVGMIRIMGLEILRNPIIIASVLGGGAHALGWEMPVVLAATLRPLAGMAVPLALLCVGAALVTTPLKGNRRIATTAALFKTMASPIIGYAIGRLAGLDRGELLVVVVLAACPTAAVSYTMVRELGGDGALAASAILLSTFLSAAALTAALVLFGI